MAVKMVFHKGGVVTLQPQGYEGKLCHEATRPYQEAFGGKQNTVETDTNATTQISESQQQQQGN